MVIWLTRANCNHDLIEIETDCSTCMANNQSSLHNMYTQNQNERKKNKNKCEAENY